MSIPTRSEIFNRATVSAESHREQRSQLNKYMLIQSSEAQNFLTIILTTTFCPRHLSIPVTPLFQQYPCFLAFGTNPRFAGEAFSRIT